MKLGLCCCGMLRFGTFSKNVARLLVLIKLMLSEIVLAFCTIKFAFVVAILNLDLLLYNLVLYRRILEFYTINNYIIKF